jgi:hypothetical protein
MKLKIGWVFLTLMIIGILLSACSIFYQTPRIVRQESSILEGPANSANGERIYFTGTSGRGTSITYRSGPNFGGMMMGSYLTCASCHGPEARGGLHTMHMQVMDAPDITYSALSSEAEEHGEDEHGDEHGGEYTLEDFRQAVIEGKHPDGEPLSRNMPRWQMNDEDLADLFEFLKSIE